MIEYVKFKRALSRIDLPSYLRARRNQDNELAKVLDLIPLMIEVLAMRDPLLYTLTILKAMNLAFRHDIVREETALTLLGYATVLSSGMGEYDEGYRIGKIALSYILENDIRTFKAQAIFIFHTHVSHWKDHLGASLPAYMDAYRIGRENGEHSTAAFALGTYCFHSLIIGKPLSALGDEIRKFAEITGELKQATMSDHLRIAESTVTRFSGFAEVSRADELCLLDSLAKKKNNYALFLFHFYGATVGYILGEYDLAFSEITEAAKYVDSIRGVSHVPIHNFLESLILTARMPESGRARSKTLKRVAANQAKLRKMATLAPMNNRHRFDLVEAETARIGGHALAAEAAYEKAIKGAEE